MATPHQARTSHFPLKYSRLRPKGSIDEADVNSDKKRAAWLEALSNDPDADFVVSWGAPSGPCNCATTAPVKPPFEEVLRIKHEPFFAKQDTSRIELWRKRGSFAFAVHQGCERVRLVRDLPNRHAEDSLVLGSTEAGTDFCVNGLDALKTSGLEEGHQLPYRQPCRGSDVTSLPQMGFRK